MLGMKGSRDGTRTRRRAGEQSRPALELSSETLLTAMATFSVSLDFSYYFLRVLELTR